MQALRALGIGIGVFAVGIGLLFVLARFLDGPIAIIPGGPLASGEWVDDPAPDFAFAEGIEEIELESSGRSRTTWVLVLAGQAYVPVSLDFPPGKSWHQEALEDPTAVVRIDGRRYRRKLVRVDDPDRKLRLGEIAVSKYGPGPSGGDIDRVWFFELAAPDA